MIPRSNRTTRGFTLLEVMVALAVAAIGLGAVAKSMTANVDVSDRLKQRTLATWVASNRLAELRMYRQFISNGGQSGKAEMGGYEWFLEEKYSATADPNISRVDIRVFQNETSRDVVSITSYVSLYKPGTGSNP